MKELQSSLFAVAVIPSVGDDEVVEKMYAHGFAGLRYVFCNLVVVSARMAVSARVVVAKHHGSGVVKQRLFHYYAHIHRRFRYSTV